MLFLLNLIKPIRLAASISVVALTVGLAACGKQETVNNPSPNSTASSTPAATTAAGGNLDLPQTLSVTGAGATFPAPLYQRWFIDLNKKYPKLQVSYQSVGSGAGIEQFIKGTVDFGASDVAMKDEEIQKVTKGVLLLPMSAGSIVITYNLPKVETGLKLPRQVYTDIFLGNIKSWDDTKIAAANPGVTLPKLPITVVHRSDGSGTTGVFTKHLSAISPDWKTKVGEGKDVKWPVGVGGKGNEGVTAQIQQSEGTIGYVEYGYAKQNNLKYAALENKAGKYIDFTPEAASKTLEAVVLPENLRAFAPDPDGDASYPIVSYTWLLIYKQYTDPIKAKALEAMIEYGLTEGQKSATELGYIPLPAKVIEKVAAVADQISPEYKINVGATPSK